MQTLQDFGHDGRFALRAMRKSMLLTATIVLCLGFSIGATSTVFAWMETLILQPAPGVNDLARLVSLKTTTVDGDGGLSYPNYTDIRDAEIRAGASIFQG